jgi:NADPH:quinone reductase-like Zn-dependent oxidoreductase
MKALEMQVAGGPEALRFSNRPTPSVAADELLLRVRCAALNYRDWDILRGAYGSFQLPLVLGSDAVAEVVQVGHGVTRFAVGERVLPTDTPDWITGPPDETRIARRLGGPLDGVLAELISVSAEAAVRAPAHLGDEEASTLAGAGVTAWQALYGSGGLEPGHTVVVQGTGGVSLFALQLARFGGANVIVLSRSAQKLERALALGATFGVDTRRTPEWQHEVLRLTNGRGADLVLDVLGGTAVARSIAATRVGGRVALLGFLEDGTAVLDLKQAIRRSVTLATSSGRSRDMFEALVRAFEAGGLHPVIDRSFAFQDAAAAFAHLASGAAFGKIVVRIAGPGEGTPPGPIDSRLAGS